MLVAISQRRTAEFPNTDTLEPAYGEYFQHFDIKLIPVDNNSSTPYVDELEIDGVVLSGGGDVHPKHYGGELDPTAHYSLERDSIERQLLQLATERTLPVLGICRGMQSLNVMFGGTITQNAKKTVESFQQHVGTRHDIAISNSVLEERLGMNSVHTNSFHDSVIYPRDLASDLLSFAVAKDGTIEGLYHPSRALAALMWHPERERSATPLNTLLTEAFKDGELFWETQR